MFEKYRARMAAIGENIRLANKRQSEDIMANSFSDSQSYRKVVIDGEEYDARIISDSKTTVRGGNGNYVIQLKNDIPLKAGTYIQVPDRQGNYDYWLSIYESDGILFPKHIIKKCNYLLKWKNTAGNIVERWAVFSDNIRLTDGERKANYNKITLSYYGTSLLLPCDEETINIKIDKRFLIDHNKVQGNPEAWIVTNRNVISKRFDNFDGVIELYVSRHQFNHNVDSKEYMIANYYVDQTPVEDIDKTAAYNCRITYNGSADLKMGTPFKNYVAKFYCDGVYQTDIIADWDIIIDEGTIDNFTYEVSDNTVKIKCKYNGSLIGSHIRLIASCAEYGCSAELPVKVVSSL